MAIISTMQTILIAIVTFGIVVTVHEYGHFWMAKRCGVKILRFSIGFGTPLLKWSDNDGVEYVVCALPLGGYVRMADSREGSVGIQDSPEAFDRQPLRSRSAIAIAGPMANFLLATLVLWGLFFYGEAGVIPTIGSIRADSMAEMAGLEVGQEIAEIDGEATPTVAAVNFALLERLGDSGRLEFGVLYPDSEMVYRSAVNIERWLHDTEQPNLLQELGISIRMPPVIPLINSLSENLPAAKAGFETGDLILSADGEPMDLWMDWVEHVRSRPNIGIEVLVDRQDGQHMLTVIPDAVINGDAIIGTVGMGVMLPKVPEAQQRRFDRNPLEALVASVDRTYNLTVFTFKSIGKMLQGLISPSNLSGPIKIAQVAASTAESGFVAWFGFLALLSVSLGALNLLPIPVLDGGHLLFYFFEALFGRPVPERVQIVSFQFGLVMVLSIMIFALYNDVSSF